MRREKLKKLDEILEHLNKSIDVLKGKLFNENKNRSDNQLVPEYIRIPNKPKFL